MRVNGHAIRAIRTAKGMTVSEVAERAGVKQPHLTNIEYERREASFSTLHRIAAVLGIADLRSVLYDVLPERVPVVDVPSTEQEVA